MFVRAARMAELDLKLRGFSKTAPAGGQFGAAVVNDSPAAARSRRKGEDILDNMVDGCPFYEPNLREEGWKGI